MISAVIITFNEEKNIARCIDSLIPVADEILVVDSFSTDATEKICREKRCGSFSMNLKVTFSRRILPCGKPLLIWCFRWMPMSA